jgi:hypothetical protein
MVLAWTLEWALPNPTLDVVEIMASLQKSMRQRWYVYGDGLRCSASLVSAWRPSACSEVQGCAQHMHAPDPQPARSAVSPWIRSVSSRL